jgi:hypothetical protein
MCEQEANEVNFSPSSSPQKSLTHLSFEVLSAAKLNPGPLVDGAHGAAAPKLSAAKLNPGPLVDDVHGAVAPKPENANDGGSRPNGGTDDPEPKVNLVAVAGECLLPSFFRDGPNSDVDVPFSFLDEESLFFATFGFDCLASDAAAPTVGAATAFVNFASCLAKSNAIAVEGKRKEERRGEERRRGEVVLPMVPI